MLNEPEALRHKAFSEILQHSTFNRLLQSFRRKKVLRSMKNITRRDLILNVEGLFVHSVFKIISGFQGWVGDGNGSVHSVDGQINI